MLRRRPGPGPGPPQQTANSREARDLSHSVTRLPQRAPSLRLVLVVSCSGILFVHRICFSRRVSETETTRVRLNKFELILNCATIVLDGRGRSLQRLCRIRIYPLHSHTHAENTRNESPSMHGWQPSLHEYNHTEWS